VHGVKPGWCRVGFHYTMDDAEADFVTDAVAFVARFGTRFLPLYEFRLRSGTWAHREHTPEPPTFSLGAALEACPESSALPADVRAERYAAALREAHAWAGRLESVLEPAALDGELGELQYFAVAAGTVADDADDDAYCGGF
jgi:hypothetical protein